MWYNSCPKCMKKVTEVGGLWKCDNPKCAANSTFENCEKRYLVQFTGCDHTSNLYLSGFNETGEKILGMNANKLSLIRDQNFSEFVKVISGARDKYYTFVVKAREEEFNGTMQVKYTCNSVTPLDFAVESERLINLIRSCG